MLDFWLLFSFVAGLVPAVLFVVLYGFRSYWRTNPAGRAMFVLALVISTSYLVSVISLAWPEFFTNDPLGIWFRIASRLIIAATLWNLLRVLLRAQKQDKKARSPILDRG